MRFDVISIFPEMFEGLAQAGVLGRAADRGSIRVDVHDLRDYAEPPHRRVDDEVFGGGPGMLFCAAPIAAAVEAVRCRGDRAAVVLTSPRGEVLTQALVRELSEYEQIVVVCDRYEGSDERVHEHVTHEVSVGDYVLTGGELAGMVIIDAVARIAPGVVGRAESIECDSFAAGILDYPCYTRPANWEGREVPPVLLGGDHGAVRRHRTREGLRETLEARPDLLRGLALDREECDILASERAYDR